MTTSSPSPAPGTPSSGGPTRGAAPTEDVRLAVLDDLALALALADRADALTLPAFAAHDFAVESKPDLTPVTDIDRAVEEMLSGLLASARPDDGFLGEEFGTRGTQTGRRWIVDPIDGTKNFVRGVPVYATLIALYDGEEPLVGVVSAPALGRRWYAATGRGAWRVVTAGRLGGATAEQEGRAADPVPERLRTSAVRALGDASLSFSSLSGWRERGTRERFLELTDAVWRTRAYGDFWSYMLVAEGTVDVACEPELALYDMAALVPIVREAGGTFTDLDGVPGPFGAHAVATNSHLHPTVLEYM
ncbi:inositol monophosphatase family protein [Brevibacterium samyangense]|uniref:Histidinol-phosphatase n=1 Tax=Brevibacterium samyangense TaxID=366888 RepID=A0ABN2T9H1_9MICO